MDEFEEYWNKLCSILDGVLESDMWPDHPLAMVLFEMPTDEARRRLRQAQAIAKCGGERIISLEHLRRATCTISLRPRKQPKRKKPPVETRCLRPRSSLVNYCEI
ncbi:uncharacterized protein LOC108164886 [Drosophila miranda]|uniref:uncharacterized protein LOC108164886 n=1 Tax=Drosophila miranda TaxID=7229 RepID=UPI0007E73CC0|nr:uncharacterized protein LOC108164886 [Drosophila miranda]